MKPLYQSSTLGFKVSVYTDRITYKPLFGLAGEKSIPINQVASVVVGMPGLQQVIIETTGGKKIKIPVKMGHKTKLRDAIYQAQSDK